jgi:hypothetical protein
MAQKLILTLQADPPPPDECWPARLRDLVAALPAWLSVAGSGQDGLTLLTHGPTEPGADDTDKPWIQTRADGSPLGLYVFHDGAWVRVYDHDAGDIIGFNGRAADVVEPFEFCDGTDGTPELRGKMIKADGTAGVDGTTDSGIYRLGYKMFVGYAP